MHSVDVIVVGSGAGGMTAAITAADQGFDTLLIEASEQFGGTSAMSGGVVWVPANHLMPKAGISDSYEEGLAYLKATTRGEVPEEKLHAYLTHAPAMLRYLEQNTHTAFNAAVEYSDYYPDLPGYKPGARSLDSKPFSRRKLKENDEDIRLPSTRPLFNRISMTAIEAHEMLKSERFRNFFILWRLLIHFLDIPMRIKGKRDNRMVLGQALAGSLRASMMDRNIPLWLNTRLQELLLEDGRVCGIRACKNGQPVTITARKGVILASGGFGKNAGMRQKYQKHPISGDWSSANPHDLGDSITAGEKIGAQLEFMHCAWWSPSFLLPKGEPESLIIGKSMPGCIFVNKAGERFTNEAAPYEDVVKGQYAANDSSPAIPCYMIMDGRYREEYALANGRIYPAKIMPDEKMPDEYKKPGFIYKADTLDELAQQMDVDAAGLATTIKRFNGFAESGVDEDFNRGGNAQDCYYSDATTGYPNPTLAPIQRPPFYGMLIWPGDLGTKGGLKTDHRGRVLDTGDNIIEGLYATGNTTGSVMGNSYPGAGSTLGPSMTFGYIAALDLAGKL